MGRRIFFPQEDGMRLVQARKESGGARALRMEAQHAPGRQKAWRKALARMRAFALAGQMVWRLAPASMERVIFFPRAALARLRAHGQMVLTARGRPEARQAGGWPALPAKG